MPTPAADHVNALLASYQDFPQVGILFRDLNPVFADAAAFRALIDELAGRFQGEFDAVAGIEARGFLLAAAIGYAADVAVLVVRKGGKLPGSVLSEEYDLEYGSACLELEIGQLAPGARVLVVDDVLATGGTIAATARLIERAGYRLTGVGVVLELTELVGRTRLGDAPVHAIVAL
ncbi:adenine phosphoribosyltransferase [Cryobacterium sp. TMT1-19]|uniref:adenine phosphoribosyltransferase n=1 Tax=unclassified Cryobacterium TaxID=2649013 RepID=UPI000CE4E34E|nr:MULTISPECIES: adenine phosphoribosyltransferase [unclassified Cryobacterium]TFC30931.1 adenine phosphoribosyltransferase [Cryobacterium sp. TMT2-18-2]TFC34372.1 adenine phosphoribosyltransferase [Cryobacterium sp. TMT2-42-4]TFC63334.1 adenine phosphoribosyltransferase [Cryobacterium sp. TMT2-18-3]TFC63957.1 adenine phosphoribosyltransferase [Cryobacterium sp. TMT2-15-1]TFD36036.1 adenine phosphoribosyltransferase [Cryobacterium sp. TMT1-19]